MPDTYGAPAGYKRPYGLLMALYVAITVGLLGLGMTIVFGRQDQMDTRNLIRDNARLIEQVEELQQIQLDSVHEHRIRNEELHADICRIIFEIVQTSPNLRNQNITPCKPPLMNGQIDPKVEK